MKALVVGGANIRGSLTAVRALARAGWSVGVGSPLRGLANYSNHCAQWHFVPSPKESLTGFIDAVNSAGEQGRYGLVFGGGDDEVLALSGARQELRMTVPYAPHENVLRALDKLQLHEAARRVGMATPRTTEANRGFPEAFEGAVIVKPNIHWTPGSKADTSRFAAVVTSQRETIERRSREILDAGRTPLIQEFIPGRLLAFVAIADRHGDMLTGFSQITDRVWPVGAGMFTRATIIPTDDQLWCQASALLKELGWFGVAQLQFQCTDEGARYLLDFNGRFYWSLALAVNAGLNLPAMWARLATDQTVGDITPLPLGTRYQWLGGDLQRAFTERRDGLLHDLGDTLRFAASATHGLWDRDDIRPFLHMLADKSAREARRTLHHFVDRSTDNSKQ